MHCSEYSNNIMVSISSCLFNTLIFLGGGFHGFVKLGVGGCFAIFLRKVIVIVGVHIAEKVSI